MNDGPTGFHVAPITEDDMNRVTSILKRAMDTMIGASQLAADVDMLRQTVSGLQADADRLRNQNNALDEALNYSRGERDRQAEKLVEVEKHARSVEQTLASIADDKDRLELTATQLQIDLDLTRKAKDDAEFKVLELEEKLSIAEAKLAKVAELHRALFPPVVEPVKDAAPSIKPEDYHEPEIYAAAEPSPVTDTRPDSLPDWEPGYRWDTDTGRYWRQGVTPKVDGEAIPF